MRRRRPKILRIFRQEKLHFRGQNAPKAHENFEDLQVGKASFQGVKRAAGTKNRMFLGVLRLKIAKKSGPEDPQRTCPNKYPPPLGKDPKRGKGGGIFARISPDVHSCLQRAGNIILQSNNRICYVLDRFDEFIRENLQVSKGRKFSTMSYFFLTSRPHKNARKH